MDKIVLITGASSGIGEGCARKFASEGARLILNARSVDKLEALAQDLKEKYGTESYIMPFDVREREVAAEALRTLPDEWKAIDVLINNAGLAMGVDKEHEGNFEEWDTMIDTNIKGLLSITRFVVPGMVERGRGDIINIGSITGAEGDGYGVDYPTSKAGLMYGFTKSLAQYGSRHGIRALCVSPGPVLTRAAMANMKTLLGRAAEPQEIIDLILFIASEKGQFINGENIMIDGGRNAMCRRLR